MVFPWIQFLGKKGKLSDIEYLSIKEFDSKLVQNDGTRTTTGDLATLTASGGKDMYLAKAKINAVHTGDLNASRTVTVVLKLNGVIVETDTMEFITGSSRSHSSQGDSYEFISIGQKVVATQIIKLEVTVIDTTSISVKGTLVCFEEDTGASPAV